MKKRINVRAVLHDILTRKKASNRRLADKHGCSHNTIKRYRNIIEETGFTLNDLDAADDDQINAVVHRTRGRDECKRLPDFEYIDVEMAKRHQTLIELWVDYRQADPASAYSYSNFTATVRGFREKLDYSMRLPHPAGQKLFVDFAGMTVPYKADRGVELAQIFVAVLGCSNFTFVLAVPDQSLRSWVTCHNKMFEFFGGVPEVVVPDNLKAAVTKTGPHVVLNKTYEDLGRHYAVEICPARPYKPQDKAKAENGVRLISRWILVKLRRRTFFSIEEINEAIQELLRQFNNRPFKNLPGCREERFEKLERPLLQPLPTTPYEFARWLEVPKIDRDYHAIVDKHAYSVPCHLIGERVEARVTDRVVEIFFKGKRIAAHQRSDEDGGFTTDDAHRPPKHRFFASHNREHYTAFAERLGSAAQAVVEAQFAEGKSHSTSALRACKNLVDLSRDFGDERFEAACKRAVGLQSLTVKSVRSILESRLDQMDQDDYPAQEELPFHSNVRGSDYFSSGASHAS